MQNNINNMDIVLTYTHHAKIVKKSQIFYENRRFITEFTEACN
jgi:hypothetical protein